MSEIKRFVLNGLESNCFVIATESGCYVVDIGGSTIDDVIKYIKSTQKEVNGVFLTHGHIDHIEGINLFCSEFKTVPVYIGEGDREFLINNQLNLAVYFPEKRFNLNSDINVIIVKEGDIIDEKFKIVETPGHTAGSVTIVFQEEGAIFTGDTMFKGNIGRTDLPTGDYKAIWKSLKKLTLLDEKFTVYPGHGELTDIKSEKENLFSESAY